jgi:hypothetical protein
VCVVCVCAVIHMCMCACMYMCGRVCANALTMVFNGHIRRERVPGKHGAGVSLQRGWRLRCWRASPQLHPADYGLGRHGSLADAPRRQRGSRDAQSIIFAGIVQASASALTHGRFACAYCIY